MVRREVEVFALSPDEATELVLRLILDMGIWIPLLVMCPLAAVLIGLSFIFDGKRRDFTPFCRCIRGYPLTV